MPRNGSKNLVPLTTEKAQEVGRKGGKASGEAKRKRKALKETMAMLLELPVYDTKSFNNMSKFGIEIDEIDNNTRLMYSLLKRAFAGDVAAVKEVRSLLGEDTSGGAMTKIDEMINAIKGDANK